MNLKRNEILVVLILVLAGVIWVLMSGDALSARAFDLTGEEETGGQLRGIIQLPLNLANPSLKTDPYTAIDDTGVNPFGVNTFLHHEVEVAKREEQLRLIEEAGFRWIRQEFPWEDIEIHDRGDFIDRRNDPAGIDAWAKYDNIVDLAEAYDQQIIARLSNPPAWSRAAGDDNGTYAPPDDYEDFARYAAAVAERYRGRIRYYQIWNEPNIYPEWGENPVDPEAYTDLLCRAYRAIKAVDPEAVVLSGALAPTAELSGRDLNDYIFLQRMYDAGAGECFDILSMQGYGLWSGPTDRRMRPLVVNYGRNQFIRDIMVRNGDAHKAIWISEMNWNVAPEDIPAPYGRVTLEQQAEWAPLAFQRAQKDWPWIGVINVWYFKRASDDWLTERRPEAYFQMLEPDFTPLPIYESIKDYANQPPIMYAGNHWADDWAATYGDGWSPWLYELDRARVSADDAGPITFTFWGTSLRIIFGAHENPEHGITYQVDDEPPVLLQQCCAREMLWRGRRGLHTVEINPVGNVVITHFIVRDDPRLTPGALIAGALLLTGAWYVARRRHVLDEAEPIDE